MSDVATGSAHEPAFPADAVEVARIGDAWGVKGWFRVIPFSSDPQAIFSSRRWFIKAQIPAGLAVPAPVTSPLPGLLRISAIKEHGDGVVAQAQDVESRAAALALRGARVFIGRSSFPTQGTDEFYWVDLIGLQVVNRQGEQLGAVLGLIETGPQSVLRVGAAPVGEGDAAPAERLIPFVAAYVDSVSLQDRLVRVDWNLDY